MRPSFALRLARLNASSNKISRSRAKCSTSGDAAPPIEPTSVPTEAQDNVDVAQVPPIEAGEDLNELVSDGSESRTRIEAIIGVGNEQMQ